jgi:signal transduction histidine kinase
MRSRIVTLAVVAAALAIACFGIPLAVAVAQYTTVYREVDLQRQADRAAARVALDLARGEAPDAGDLEDYDSLTFRSVYDLDRDRLLGRGPATADYTVRQAEDGTADTGVRGDEIVVAVPVNHEGEVVGVVRVAGPRGALLWPVWAAWLGMAGLALVALGLVWLLARRQARRLARPLDDVAAAATRLGDGDFSVRLPAVAYPEIDAVVSSLNATAARLDDLLTRERAFSAEASHQLRTPLTSLRLRLEGALAHPDGDLRGAIHAGLDAADRIESTIDELLVLARDRDRVLEAVDVGALLPPLTEPWATRLAAGGRSLRLVVEPGTPPAMASAAAVRQVLTVLLDNAAVHGAGRVDVAVRDAGGAVAVEVADQGDGVPEDGADLWARRPREDGHGIGLALARRLAEAEGGHLRLASPAPPVFALLLPTAGPR